MPDASKDMVQLTLWQKRPWQISPFALLDNAGDFSRGKRNTGLTYFLRRWPQGLTFVFPEMIVPLEIEHGSAKIDF